MALFEPAKKKYSEMSNDEAAYVRMQAEEAAKNFITRYRDKPFLLKIAAIIIAAHAERLEPTPKPEDSWTTD